MAATAVRNLGRLWRKIFVSQSIYNLYSQMARFVVWQVEIITLSYSLSLFLQMWCSQYIFQYCKNTKIGFFTTYSWRETLVCIRDSTCIKNWTVLLLLVMPVLYYSKKVLFFSLTNTSVSYIAPPGTVTQQKKDLSLRVVTSMLVCTALNMIFTITCKTYTQKVWGVFFCNFPFIRR